jgi:hypothetical protein
MIGSVSTRFGRRRNRRTSSRAIPAPARPAGRRQPIRSRFRGARVSAVDPSTRRSVDRIASAGHETSEVERARADRRFSAAETGRALSPVVGFGLSASGERRTGSRPRPSPPAVAPLFGSSAVRTAVSVAATGDATGTAAGRVSSAAVDSADATSAFAAGSASSTVAATGGSAASADADGLSDDPGLDDPADAPAAASTSVAASGLVRAGRNTSGSTYPWSSVVDRRPK